MARDDAEVRHPLFARMYVRTAAGEEERGAREHRRELLAGARGRVLELGAGHGLNFAHYPPEVESVLAVEPEPHLRALASEAALSAPVAVEVVDATAARLPADDASIDTGVASLVLCTVPDQAGALAELRRVIKPGGELRFYEHVLARGGLSRVQRVLDATLWPRIAGGCHLTRDTVREIEGSGFELERCRRFGFSPGPLVPAIPHVLGLARRP